MPESLPPEIVEFIITHLRSLNDLRVLIECVGASDRWWDASALSRHTGISVAAARHSLEHLAGGNLLDIKITDDVRYNFSPGSDTLRAAALGCAARFRSHPLTVVELVVRSARGSLRDFADAFRIRRDDDR